MPVLIQVDGATKSYGERTLFADANLQITEQMKIGVVGPNGAGKSTFCRSILERKNSTSVRSPSMPIYASPIYSSTIHFMMVNRCWIICFAKAACPIGAVQK